MIDSLEMIIDSFKMNEGDWYVSQKEIIHSPKPSIEPSQQTTYLSKQIKCSTKRMKWSARQNP